MTLTLAPGYDVGVGDRGPAAPDPGDVGTFFMATLTDRGPANTPVESRSLAQWRSVFGSKVAWSDTDRVVEAFFREGGSRIVTSRAVGPTPTTGLLALSNVTPAVCVTISALGPGAYSSNYKVTVATGSGSVRTVTIKNGADTILTATVSTSADLKAAVDATGELTAAVGAGVWPIAVLAETALSAGTDDHASVTTTQWQAALDAIDRDLGAGQVAVPGITTAEVHALLEDHATDNNRFALKLLADVATVATLTAAVVASRARGKDAAASICLAGWEQVTIDGATVAIPPEGSVAGRMARVDRAAVEGPAQPAAGDYGISTWSTGVTQTWTEAERETLNEAGIAVIRQMKNGVQLYGYRTPVDPVTWPQYVEVNGMRVLMAIRSECESILAGFVIRNLDGNGHLLGELNGAITADLTSWYGRRALYGSTPQEAFAVDTSSAINPPEQLTARKIKAQALVATTPFAERVELTITKVAAGDSI